MRLYAIRNTETNMYAQRLRRTLDGQWYVHWIESLPLDEYQDIEWLNCMIENIILHKVNTNLDKCEILTAERRFVPIKSSIKMKTYKDRHEKNIVMQKLKG